MAGSGEQFVPMYFVFVAFILGAVTFSFTERFTYGRVPYVFLMFMEGVALGYLANAAENDLGDFSQSFLIWQDIDPFLLLAVFLPGLLFGDGMETETYQLARIAPQLILLCLFGTVIMTCLMAVVSSYFLIGGTWKIYGCFLFGAILSSPDPVVLINLLESTSNAPEKYKLLTGSESHFCDMTSFTLFTVFFKIVTEGLEAEFGDAAESAQFFAFNILGGPFTGLLAGFLAYYLIVQTKLTGKPMDSIVQITITVVCAYLSFLISEHVLSGNGILATIVAALVLAAYAKSSYVDSHSVETVWKVIEFLATTIVIFLSGVIASRVLFEANIPDYSDLLVDVLIVYGCLMIARIITISVLYFPLDRVGDYSFKEAVCMSWCNIRGALTLTLALAVVRIDTGKFEKALNKFFFDATNATLAGDGGVNTTLRLLAAGDEDSVENPVLKEQLSRFYLIIALVVLLTIMINYTMADRVFRMTGLLDGYTKRNKIKDKTVRAYIDVRIRRKYREILHLLINKYNNQELIDLDFLDKSLQFFIKREYVKAQDGEIETSNTSAPLMTVSREELAADTFDLAAVESKANSVELNKMQALFYKALKQSYWSQIDSGIIPKGSAIALKLLYSANIGADEKMVLKSDFEALNLPEIDVESKQIGVTTNYGRFIRLLDWITGGNFDLLSRHEQALLREAVYVCTCYIDAHQDAEEKIAGAMGAGTAIDTYEEATVIKRSMLVTEEAYQYMQRAKVLNKDVEILVETLKIGSAMIVGHQKYMAELKEEGLVEDYEVQKEFEFLKQQKAVIKNREGFSRAFHKELRKRDTDKELNRGRVGSFLGGMRKKSKAKKEVDDKEEDDEHIIATLEDGKLTDEEKAEEEASTRKLVPTNNAKKDI